MEGQPCAQTISRLAPQLEELNIESSCWLFHSFVNKNLRVYSERLYNGRILPRVIIRVQQKNYFKLEGAVTNVGPTIQHINIQEYLQIFAL